MSDQNNNIYNNLTELIGSTPMLHLNGFCKKHGIDAQIIAKLEYFNPLGSSKDRVGAALISAAEENKLLTDNTVIIEPTSGNTGIGLAFTASIKGYKLILVMPENMSKERIQLLSALGAEIVLTPAEEGMAGAIRVSKELAEKYDNVFIPDQFSNPSNSRIHKETTGTEILAATNGKLDCFVAGVGTGGTITGVGEALKETNDSIRIVAVEPSNSAVLSGGSKGVHGIMGIGAGFIPEILNTEIIDEIFTVTDEQAYTAAREIAKSDGLLIGISSGAALYAAMQIALKNNNPDYRIVVLFPDSGERYLSTKLFDC